jgi:hypothetical protein
MISFRRTFPSLRPFSANRNDFKRSKKSQNVEPERGSDQNLLPTLNHTLGTVIDSNPLCLVAANTLRWHRKLIVIITNFFCDAIVPVVRVKDQRRTTSFGSPYHKIDPSAKEQEWTFLCIPSAEEPFTQSSPRREAFIWDV